MKEEISGTTGELTWKISNNTLTISGVGKMQSFYYDGLNSGYIERPWQYYNSDIYTVIIEIGVSLIGCAAFLNCKNLTSITIPESVTRIEGEAFRDCENLTSIIIPNNVEFVAYWAFEGCKNLTSIIVESENNNYASENGVLFNKSKDNLIYCPEGKTGDYFIPKTVKSIGRKAFADCTSLTSITIFNSVKSIEGGAFRDCENLTSIIIPESVTSINKGDFFGDSTFWGCKTLTSINVESENKIYASENGVLFNKSKDNLIYCPEGKTGKYIIPNSVTNIGEKAFSGCKNLTSIVIPSSVTSIDDSAFWGCETLTSINVESENKIYASKNGALFKRTGQLLWRLSNNTLIISGNGDMPNYIDYNDDVSSFDELLHSPYRAPWFRYSQDERDAYGSYINVAFNTVIIERGVTSIGEEAFWGCDNIIEITIPYTVENIGKRAFWGCDALTYINTEYGYYTSENGVLFKNKDTLVYCAKTQRGMYVIPNTVTNIEEDAFEDCKNLISIIIPNSVKSIGCGAFRGCENLTSIIIPESVTRIEGEAFCGCKSLISIAIPNSVTSIGEYAFYGCNNLKSIIISDSVINIEDGAFSTCKSLTFINIEKGNNSYVFEDGALFNKSKDTLICCLTEKTDMYIIPNSVKNIGNEAFRNCRNLTSIIIPNSVTCIGKSAFSGCTSLTSIIIPNSVTCIGKSAFSVCTSLTSIIIPNSVTSIDENTFSGCTSLTSIIIPNSVTSIGAYAFSGNYPGWNCNSLTSVVIPNSVISIGKRAFLDCLNLTSIIIPNSVIDIEKEAFKGCLELTITIPDSVINIGENAFEDCKNLNQQINHQKKIENPTNTSQQYLFFDTETTGIPKNYNAPVSDLNNWPRLVQLAWILCDENGNEILSSSKIIYPNGFSIPAEASKVHKITTEIALRQGVDLRDTLNKFIEIVDKAVLIIGHNISFDINIIGAELLRIGSNFRLNNKPSICTMLKTTNYCAIPNQYQYGDPYKWPKLQELHKKLFGHEFEEAHDAMADIKATKKCFFELLKRNIISVY